ncbi:ATP-binding protein [Streptomyces pluripotens]|uniref:ATP-binding protein n=1 Tax=Streptomyces pluripotens TaxID=1355015 RepID=A0A221P8Y2_9ACTN|nr:MULTISPECIES: ATP-binding protein [Streptomyces]ARP74404.1 ATP-binding protein [Streptomyces pluripotens]ASN28680.1 ATP-binding protein [Streptomyces pluripotens]MCH0559533.1 ATP-binding protein [Streptomyces sp. MUM 16J]
MSPTPTSLTHDWSMSYPMTARSVRLARLHVRRHLTLWNWTGDIEDAVLVTSELVTNAVLHGRAPGHELWLRLAELEDGGLLVDVSDPVPAFPEPGGRKVGGESGRGLLLVGRLAEELDWFLRAEVGKTVRARLGTAAPGRPVSPGWRSRPR